MLWLKRREEISALNQVLISSFDEVKRDVSTLYQWVSFLHGENQKQLQQIESLNAQLKALPHMLSSDDIKKIVDSHYKFESVNHQIRQMEKKLNSVQSEKRSEISQENTVLLERLNLISDRLKGIGSEARQEMQAAVKLRDAPSLSSHLKEKIIKKVTKNSKEYIKQIIMDLIRKYRKISGLQLREIVVEEQGLCSKSSFYRLLAEVEQELEDLSVVEVGKEKVYSRSHIQSHQQSEK